MKNNYKISVIVPVYNGHEYIEKCVKNLINQTYKNIEIIIVNDGSTDDTNDILLKYTSNPKIKVYNNLNHGVSYSRNYGIEKSTGDYIMFVDADDELLVDGIEKLVKFANDHPNYDIIRYNGFEENINGSMTKLESVEKYNGEYLDKKTVFDLFISSKNSIRGYCWLLLLKRFDIVKFKENLKYMEDTVFSIENILKKKNVVFVDEYIYLYKYNSDSITKKTSNLISKLKYLIDTYDSIKPIICDLSQDYKEKVKNYFIKTLIRKICTISKLIKYKDFKIHCNKIYNDKALMQFLICDLRTIDDIKIKFLYILFFKKKLYLIYLINKLKK